MATLRGWAVRSLRQTGLVREGDGMNMFRMVWVFDTMTDKGYIVRCPKVLARYICWRSSRQLDYTFLLSDVS